MVYLKQKRLEITDPLLAEAIAYNEFKVQKNIEADKSPQLVINDRFLKKGTINPKRAKEQKEQMMNRYRM